VYDHVVAHHKAKKAQREKEKAARKSARKADMQAATKELRLIMAKNEDEDIFYSEEDSEWEYMTAEL
jgi:hypothetical protein